MISVLHQPDHSRGEWRFRLFGVPVRVQPWFWLTILMMSGTQDTGLALIWLGVCFVSILAHEMGHVFAFRSFGEEAEALLYGWGGLAIPKGKVAMSPLQRVKISLAGPGAGFALAIAVSAVALAWGARLHLEFHSLVIPSLRASIFPALPDPARRMTYYYWNVLVNDLLYVNIYWGLINLLPIYPLDGGQVSRVLFQKKDPIAGIRRSLILSIATGVTLAVIGLLTHSIYLVFLFGILAAGSAQALQAHRSTFQPRPDRG
jgi:stage IV sporulation protein FB